MRAILIFGLLLLGTVFAHAQDRRTVSEPSFPPVCAVFRAPLALYKDGPIAGGGTATEENSESAGETTQLAAFLDGCQKRPGSAVELALGDTPAQSAFLLDPITVPAGLSLIIDGGVTVYASRDPANYELIGPKRSSVAPCGYPTLLCRWVRQFGARRAAAEAGRLATDPWLKPVPIPTADQAAEIARLRRECDLLSMERNI